jgi:tRNA (guanine37-N1)-methyltransferase
VPELEQYLKEAFGVAIPKRDVQKTFQLLRKLKLIDTMLKLARTSDAVLIPLMREPSPENINRIKEQCANAQIVQYFFEKTETKPRNLLESLRGKIPENLLQSFPHSFDIIGDIAIIDLPRELTEFSSTVGEGIMAINPHLRLVLRKSGEVSGTFRTRKFEAIAGNGNTETIHKEFSCIFNLDVAKVYFNPRLSHERMRVARQVKKGEYVFDMFAGVGPYSILIGKTQRNSRIYSVDINPDAFRYLEHNILLNRVADRVVPILGDAGQLAARDLQGTVDRVIMNLPSESNRFLEAAVQALKEEGGIIHYYMFASRSHSVDEIRKAVQSTIERQGRNVRAFAFSDVVKEVAPNRVQVALDVVVE